MVDSNEGSLSRARDAIKSELVNYGSSLDAVADCDLVLESIIEKRAAKRSLLADVSPILKPGAILATNTSTIPISQLAAGLPDASRFCGIHFCHPVGLRPLVEIIPGSETCADTLSTIVAYTLLLGKLPLIVADGPGFVVNRLLVTYFSAALSLLTEGVPATLIDEALTNFGMSMGPIEMLDEVGLDTALQCGMVVAELFGDALPGTELLVRLVKSGSTGRKTSAGFYCYPEKSLNPVVTKMLCKSIKFPSQDAIVARILAATAKEGERLLDEGKMIGSWQIDLTMTFGLGFPLARGGLLWDKAEKCKGPS